MKVSIIIIAKEQKEIDEHIERLKVQEADFNVEYCGSTKNGFAEAYQEALENATGDIVVFTETDVRPITKTWLKELVSAVEDNSIVHGITATDKTPNMANTALKRELALKYKRNSEWHASEDTEWILRMQTDGVKWVQLDCAPVYHERPAVRLSHLERAYQYGRDWVKLIKKYKYYDLQTLIRRFEIDEQIAKETLRGIRDELNQ